MLYSQMAYIVNADAPKMTRRCHHGGSLAEYGAALFA